MINRLTNDPTAFALECAYAFRCDPQARLSSLEARCIDRTLRITATLSNKQVITSKESWPHPWNPSFKRAIEKNYFAQVQLVRQGILNMLTNCAQA